MFGLNNTPNSNYLVIETGVVHPVSHRAAEVRRLLERHDDWGQAMSAESTGARSESEAARSGGGRWVPASRLTILLAEDDLWRHRPRYHEIVRRARDSGLAGASVWRGVEGYGVSSHIHTARLLDLAERLPVLVMIIDETDRLREFVEHHADLLDSVTVALSPVEVLDGIRR